MPEIKEIDVDVTPRRRYYLRSESITASIKEAKKLFQLKDKSVFWARVLRLFQSWQSLLVQRLPQFCSSGQVLPGQ